jgi:hypothetical protein
MTARNFEDRARDVELVADTITNAVKAALPAMVRKEVEMQLAARQAAPRKTTAITRNSNELPPHPWPPTLPRPEKE